MNRKTIIFLVLLSSWAAAQAPTAIVLTPSPSQYKQLVARRAQLEKLQSQIQKLQIELTWQGQQFQTLCRTIALQNRWSEYVQCNPNSLLFYEVPPAAAPVSAPASVKPEEKPKP